MQHEGTVHVPRDTGSRALSFTEACGLIMKREGGEKYNVFSSPFSVPLPGPI